MTTGAPLPDNPSAPDPQSADAALVLPKGERRFQLLVESVQDYSLVLLDREGRIAAWNSGAERLLGYREAEVLGEHFSCMFTPEDIQQGLPQRELQKARQEGRAENDHWHVRQDGTRFWGSGVTTPVWDVTLLGYVSVIRDLTEQREAQNALRESEQRHRALVAELEEINRHRERFLATLSHELRSPLAPILTALQVMRQDQTESATQRETRGVIERQVRQLTRLVDDLLETSRLTAGKLQLRKQPVELGTILARTTEAAQPLIDEHRHQLSVSIPDEPIWLDADPARLQQIFLNLIHNAAKFTPDGGQIQLTAARQEAEVTVSVRDTGAGIAAEMLDSIFEMFAQVETSRNQSQGGLGIGLTLVKHLTEMHGGSVSAKSDGPDRGSEFAVRLPVQTEHDRQRQSNADDCTVAACGCRILVVDDSQDAATMTSLLLTSLGNEARIAYSGQEALEVGPSFRPQVVLMDVGMPDMDGYETVRRMRDQTWSEQAILVAITGWGREEDRRRSREAGFHHHLVKPVEVSVLRELLNTVRPRQPSPV